ncbi:uncharacterized protein CANTADRAFT_19027 [Suhomyces tanzawaensis NRRL Y-17324]|uniref:Uncharacterized protein n=1 Tax=Suhomyces tanzawaensis NRRL Y-17324 TaxID=984487 RepID=A0A1E4SPG8_9ASCO|nr:uncharacterized protein CANTADRAFT_19027 [Suhomyces tanzawaensis NRRL Y-17324]ODV81386.1 hypothetical protein CANTADRAFT_19027 [Suhomyces tanzawaensis NRRL Y-17324]
MPPQITFIQLTSSTVIPIKVFAKSPAAGTSSPQSLAINSKSLITLTNATNYHTKLSKNYLNTLVESILDDVLETLLHRPVKDMEIRGPINSANSARVVRRVKVRGARSRHGNHDGGVAPESGAESERVARVEIPLVLLANVRTRFARLEENDAQRLFPKGVVSDKPIRPDGTLSLLKKQTTMEDMILIEEEEGIPIESDSKKNIGYRVDKLHMFSNINHCIRVFLNA